MAADWPPSNHLLKIFGGNSTLNSRAGHKALFGAESPPGAYRFLVVKPKDLLAQGIESENEFPDSEQAGMVRSVPMMRFDFCALPNWCVCTPIIVYRCLLLRLLCISLKCRFLTAYPAYFRWKKEAAVVGLLNPWRNTLGQLWFPSACYMMFIFI